MQILSTPISPYVYPGIRGSYDIIGTTPRVIRAVTDTTGISYEQITATKIGRKHTHARHLLLYIMRRVYPRLTLRELSVEAIGRPLDHSTVLHALSNVTGWRQYDSEVASQITSIESLIADILAKAA
jgi:chromosomal replication initiation ATPase DnaA